MSCPALLYHYACLPCFKNAPPKSELLERATLAEVGCYIWYQSIWFTRRDKKVFKTFEKLFSKPSIKYFPKKSLVILKGLFPKKPLALSFVPLT